MKRLVVVSNRVGPIRDSARAGGLAVALVDALKDRGGLWFGWTGKISEKGTHGPVHQKAEGNVRLATIDLTRADYDEYYSGYANSTLWPVFHLRLDLANFDHRFEDGYRRVNRRFAAQLAPLLKPDDVIWVHDYHLIPLGAELRAMGWQGPIGFFLHIPFPASEILKALPHHDWLARALSAYDLVGLQTRADRNALVRYLEEEDMGEHIEDGRLRAFGRKLSVQAFPIGIDAGTFARFATSADARRQIGRLRDLLGKRLQIIGVDRLDYSKGVPNRFRAFGRMLEDYPDNRGQISFLQILPPSRENVDAYAEIKADLEALSGEINGRFGDYDWTPIRYINRAFARRSLAGFYRASRIGLVTPLRDGMNLVAKEYIAAQDPANPGVLILSQFAGAAEQLRDALIVNPYAEEDMAEALQRAVHMPLKERTRRWESLYHVVESEDVVKWREDFLAALEAAHNKARRP